MNCIVCSVRILDLDTKPQCFQSQFSVPMEIKCQTTSSSSVSEPASLTPPSTATTLTTSTRKTSMSAVLAALCGTCCRPICDRYIMRVADAYYHERCLQCTSCSMRLMHSCFSRNGKLYCRIDYERYSIYHDARAAAE